MKTLKIVSKTELGEKAIQTHVNECLKQKWVVRQALKKTGFNQELSSEIPLSLTIWASPNSMFSMAKPNHVQEEIDATMKANGAERNIDYYYEVIE